MPFGPQAGGMCRIYYFGATGGMPGPMFQLNPGQMASFALSSGGSVIGAYPQQLIPPNIGFQGYIIIDCEFPGAYGFADVMNFQKSGIGAGYIATVLPQRSGACKVEFPYGYVPLSDALQVIGPDSRGDFVVFGHMTMANYRTELDLALPDFLDQMYCNLIQVAPSLIVQTYVPSSDERRGDFSHFGKPIIDPGNGLPFIGNIIPSTLLGTFMAWRYRATGYQTVLTTSNSSGIGVLNLLK
jgi:hypothetical protein